MARRPPKGQLLRPTVLLLGLTACGPRPVSASEPTIIGGRNVGAASALPTRTSTLAITKRDLLAKGHSFCSAVLIGPRTALTAAHCVTDDRGEPLDPRDMIIAQGTTLRANSTTHVPVIASAVHRRYRPGALELGDWTDFNDLAILQLAKNPEKTRPIHLMNPNKAVQKKERLTLAGYGVTSTRAVDDTGVLRSVLVRVQDLEDDIHIFMTEGAKRPGASLGSPGPQGRRRILPVHAGACAGDSGGPAYRKKEGGKTWELVGILSFGMEMQRVGGNAGEYHCTGSNGYTNLGPYVSTIKKAMEAINRKKACLGATFEFDEENLKVLSPGSCSRQSET